MQHNIHDDDIEIVEEQEWKVGLTLTETDCLIGPEGGRPVVDALVPCPPEPPCQQPALLRTRTLSSSPLGALTLSCPVPFCHAKMESVGSLKKHLAAKHNEGVSMLKAQTTQVISVLKNVLL